MSFTLVLYRGVVSLDPCCFSQKIRAKVATNARFLYTGSLYKLHHSTLSLHTRKPSSNEVVCFASQFDFVEVAQNLWKVGKDGVEFGTNLVPESVPRPVARIGVIIAFLTIARLLLGSFLSTVFFVAATMGAVYFAYLALNKDQGPTDADV